MDISKHLDVLIVNGTASLLRGLRAVKDFNAVAAQAAHGSVRPAYDAGPTRRTGEVLLGGHCRGLSSPGVYGAHVRLMYDRYGHRFGLFIARCLARACCLRLRSLCKRAFMAYNSSVFRIMVLVGAATNGRG